MEFNLFITITFKISFLLYFISAVGYIFFSVLKKNGVGFISFIFLILGFIFNTLNIIFRTLAAHRLPFATMYEVLLVFSWGIALFLIILQINRRMRLLGTLVTPVIFIFTFYASMLPSDIKNLMPALKSDWLIYHVGMAIIAYGAFAVSFGLGILYLWRERKERTDSSNPLLQEIPDLSSLDKLIYQLIAMAFPFLALVIITGAIWAQQAFATFWQWDPKETWSLITLLVYAAYLHARFVFKSRARICAIIAVIGFIIVIFCFLGVNLLMSGHHSEITR